MMAASDVSVIKESAIYQPLLADEPLVVLVWSGVSSQCKTALHFMNVKENLNYLNLNYQKHLTAMNTFSSRCI